MNFAKCNACSFYIRLKGQQPQNCLQKVLDISEHSVNNEQKNFCDGRKTIGYERTIGYR